MDNIEVMSQKKLRDEMNLRRYSHTQIGWVIIIALGLATIYVMVREFPHIPFVVLAILGICLILFPTLTVMSDPDSLEIRFGSGIIRKRFLFKDIESCRVVKNPWYYGWGIRCIPHGWMYNVSGLYAVEIQMKNGKRYRIGTDVPEELAQFIRQQTAR